MSFGVTQEEITNVIGFTPPLIEEQVAEEDTPVFEQQGEQAAEEETSIVEQPEEEVPVLEESLSSGMVSITNSGDYHNNILSNFSGAVNTNGGDLIVDFNNKEEE